MCTDNATTERALRCLTKVPTDMLVWNASTRRGSGDEQTQKRGLGSEASIALNLHKGPRRRRAEHVY